MKFLLFQAGLLCLVINIAFGQGSVRGIVTDAAGSPLADVNVYIPTLQTGTTSDKFGYINIRNVPEGTYDLVISSIGFNTAQETVKVVNNQSVSIAVVLSQGELVLGDVIVTDQLLREVNSISQVDMKLRPINTSQDILRMVPGLFIAQHAGGGKAEQIFLRGFDIDHGTDINLEVDGLPVNMVSHAHGQGYSDLHFLIPELVGSVDFNKGPYYAERGNMTTAGYASFRTKNNLEQNMVKVEGGRFGTLRNVNAINILRRHEGDWRQDAYVASEYFRTDGYFEENQHFNRLNLMGRYNAYRGDKESLSIGLSTFNSRWDASGQIPLRSVKDGTINRFGAIDPTEGGETSRSNIWVRYLNKSDNGGIFENYLYMSRYDFNLVSNFTFFLNDPVNGDQITQRESRKIYGYKGSYTIDHFVKKVGIQSQFGAGFRYDDVNDVHLYRTRSRKEFIGDVARGDIDETNVWLYADETLHISDKLTLNAALRFDHFTFNHVDALTADYERQSVSEWLLSPKASVTYDVLRNLSVFVKGGIGFHSNDTRVVVARRGKDILPKAMGVDVGANLKIGDKLLISTAFWMLDLDQEFVYVGDEGIMEPGGETTRKGIDLSLRYQALPWLYLDTDLNWTDPRAKDTPDGEDYIPLAPTFTSIGGISVQFDNGIDAGIRYRYLGDRAANEDNSVVANGYFLVDAVLKYTRNNYEISFSAENLFNDEWNEAQFDTESRLANEAEPVSEIHFTPGSPFFFKAGISFLF